MLDRQKFVELMTGLSQLYEKEVSQFALELYYDILKGYEYAQVDKAVKQVVSNNKFNCLPKPAEILEYLEGTRDEKAMQAWLLVREAILKAGYYATVEFADPLISNCIDALGGWMWINSQDAKEFPFIEKRFCDFYRLFMKRGVLRSKPMIGFVEATNGEKGYIDHIDRKSTRLNSSHCG